MLRRHAGRRRHRRQRLDALAFTRQHQPGAVALSGAARSAWPTTATSSSTYTANRNSLPSFACTSITATPAGDRISISTRSRGA